MTLVQIFRSPAEILPKYYTQNGGCRRLISTCSSSFDHPTFCRTRIASTHQISSKLGNVDGLLLLKHSQYGRRSPHRILQDIDLTILWPVKAHFLPTYKIWCIYFNLQPRYSLTTKFKMVSADRSFLLPVSSSPCTHNASAHQISSKSDSFG